MPPSRASPRRWPGTSLRARARQGSRTRTFVASRTWRKTGSQLRPCVPLGTVALPHANARARSARSSAPPRGRRFHEASHPEYYDDGYYGPPPQRSHFGGRGPGQNGGHRRPIQAWPPSFTGCYNCLQVRPGGPLGQRVPKPAPSQQAAATAVSAPGCAHRGSCWTCAQHESYW